MSNRRVGIVPREVFDALGRDGISETARLLKAMNRRLERRASFMGNAYSIVDMSLVGWVRNIVGLFDAADSLDFDSNPNGAVWLRRCLARPAVQRGLNMPPRP